MTYIRSRIWADDEGGNRCGTVVIQEQQFFAAREVAKVDASPGGYVATGGHGGILGQVTHGGVPYLMYVPAYRHTADFPRQPHAAAELGQERRSSAPRASQAFEVAIKDEEAASSRDAIPSVSIVKDGGYAAATPSATIRRTRPISGSSSATGSRAAAFAGFVIEGLVPYGAADFGTARRDAARGEL